VNFFTLFCLLRHRADAVKLTTPRGLRIIFSFSATTTYRKMIAIVNPQAPGVGRPLVPVVMPVQRNAEPAFKQAAAAH
jgi:hypothetical protein